MIDKFIPGVLAVASAAYLAGQAIPIGDAPPDTVIARPAPDEVDTDTSTARQRAERQILAATDAVWDVQTKIAGVLVRLAKRAGVPTNDLEIAVEEGSSATTGGVPSPPDAPSAPEPPSTSSDPPEPDPPSAPDDPVPVPLPTPSPSPTPCDLEVGSVCVDGLPNPERG